MSAISSHTQDILDKIYADGKVSPQEIMELRDHARSMRDEIAGLDGTDSPVVQLLDRMQMLAEEMQTDMLAVRVADYSDMGKMQLMSAIENNVALLKANFDGFKS